MWVSNTHNISNWDTTHSNGKYDTGVIEGSDRIDGAFMGLERVKFKVPCEGMNPTPTITDVYMTTTRCCAGHICSLER